MLIYGCNPCSQLHQKKGSCRQLSLSGNQERIVEGESRGSSGQIIKRNFAVAGRMRYGEDQQDVEELVIPRQILFFPLLFRIITARICLHVEHRENFRGDGYGRNE